MMRKVLSLFPQPITARTEICVLSLTAGVAAFATTLLFQWLVYDDWMHWKGPLRVVGSTLAGALACMLTAHLQAVWRRWEIESLRRFETTARMHDRIRNALQVIQYVDYGSTLGATESVQNAVRTIDFFLKQALSEANPSLVDGAHRNANEWRRRSANYESKCPFVGLSQRVHITGWSHFETEHIQQIH